MQRLTERVSVARSEPEHRASAIHQAIDEVMDIVEALKRAVDQMEEVLELVELAERQKLADEREIESLRRALRGLHDRPREQSRGGGPRDQRGPRENRDQRDQREHREQQREPQGSRDFRQPREEAEPHDAAPSSEVPPPEN